RRFYEHHQMTLAKQGDKISYSYTIFHKIFSACDERKSGRIFYSEDARGDIHSAIFVIWDIHSAYYLISSIDPDHRNSGSTTLLIAHAMREISTKTKRFDFEGSMNPGVENSFRKFGAVQKPILHVWKDRRSAADKILFRMKSYLVKFIQK